MLKVWFFIETILNDVFRLQEKTSVIHPKCSMGNICLHEWPKYMVNLVGKYSIDGAYGNGWGRAFAVAVCF